MPNATTDTKSRNHRCSNPKFGSALNKSHLCQREVWRECKYMWQQIADTLRLISGFGSALNNKPLLIKGGVGVDCIYTWRQTADTLSLMSGFGSALHNKPPLVKGRFGGNVNMCGDKQSTL